MNNKDTHAEIGGAGEDTVAHAAAERLFARVDAHVRVEVGLARKVLAAVGVAADKRPRIAVRLLLVPLPVAVLQEERNVPK